MKYQNIFGLVFLASYNTLSATNYQVNIKKLSPYPLTRNIDVCSKVATESPLEMVKNAFYFILKALFVLKIFKFLSWDFL